MIYRMLYKGFQAANVTSKVTRSRLFLLVHRPKISYHYSTVFHDILYRFQDIVSYSHKLKKSRDLNVSIFGESIILALMLLLNINPRTELELSSFISSKNTMRP